MTEQLVEPALTECPTCKKEYKSLSQHWTRSENCDFPTIDDEIHEFIQGLLLGDGSIEGKKKAMLSIDSTNRPFLEWCHNKLGFLSRGIISDDRTNRIRTMAHPELDRYWKFDKTDLSRDLRLTPHMARAWYVCDGSLDFGKSDRPYAAFSATDNDFRARASGLVEEAGFDTRDWDRRFVIAKDDVEDWLSWIGEPVDGLEYKWALDHNVYNYIREYGVEDFSPDSKLKTGRRSVNKLLEDGPTLVRKLGKIKIADKMAGVSTLNIDTRTSGGNVKGRADLHPVAYLFDIHTDVEVARAWIEANQHWCDAYSNNSDLLVAISKSAGKRWSKAFKSSLDTQ